MPFQVAATPEPAKLWLSSLDASDTPEQERTYVTMRQANGHDQLMLEQITTGPALSYEMDGLGKVKETPNTPEYVIVARKVFCVMTACNILDVEGQPLFQKDMAWNAFMEAWAQLPAIVRDAIFAKVTQVNPHWGNA